jgi:hypothetical protein
MVGLGSIFVVIKGGEKRRNKEWYLKRIMNRSATPKCDNETYRPVCDAI